MVLLYCYKYGGWVVTTFIFFTDLRLRRGFESLQTRASRQPLAANALFRSQVNPYVTSNKVALREISEYVGFSPVSIIPPIVYTRLNLQVCCYKEVKWLKLRNLPTGSALSVIWQHWIERTFTFRSSVDSVKCRSCDHVFWGVYMFFFSITEVLGLSFTEYTRVLRRGNCMDLYVATCM